MSDDKRDEYSDAIDAAFPTRSGKHDAYGIAMRMVGSRHSKSALVALVTWLLVERDAAAKAERARIVSRLRTEFALNRNAQLIANEIERGEADGHPTPPTAPPVVITPPMTIEPKGTPLADPRDADLAALRETCERYESRIASLESDLAAATVLEIGPIRVVKMSEDEDGEEWGVSDPAHFIKSFRTLREAIAFARELAGGKKGE